MMVRHIFVVLVLLAGWAQVASAQTCWIEEICRSVGRDTIRNNCWPEPFVCPDRQTVRSPFAIMVSNGWRLQNLIGEHYFDKETNDLTEAGRLKIQWIMTQTPQRYRVIFVGRTPSAEDTAARVHAVQQVALQLAGDDRLPPVLETDIPASAWPADRVDMIDSMYRDSMPAPRLPELDTGES